jgi:cell division protein FtsX
VKADRATFRTIAWGPLIVVAIGVLLFLLGAGRFFLRERFSFSDALYCCLAIVPAGLALLVFDYVLHHARLASVILLFMGAVLIFSSPVVDVALGLALVGAMVGPAVSEWKQGKRLRQSEKENGNEGEP